VVLLIRGKSACSICGSVIAVGEDAVGFAPCLDPSHPLWSCSDSAMHASCYETWSEKERFSALYAEAEARRQKVGIEPLDRASQRLADERHNLRHDEILTLVRDRGAACPHCGVRSTAYRELAGTARRRLACVTCYRSFNADELCLA
jgi:predicted RNA-binding Zn-ribbon protein involved in translation (DUF1610 family)